MRPEKLYLSDILEAADALQRFCEHRNFADFKADEMFQSAVLQKLIVIGEAASHLSVEFRERYTEIEWQDIIGFRNIAVHEYFAIMWEIVWVAAAKEVPMLRTKINNIIKEQSD